jgi:hypothetical protein
LNAEAPGLTDPVNSIRSFATTLPAAAARPDVGE